MTIFSFSSSLTIIAIVVCLLNSVESFLPVVHPLVVRTSSLTTALYYRNETSTFLDVAKPKRTSVRNRQELKDALAIAAIEDYDMDAYNAGMTTIAEDLMRSLEHVRPWSNPAHHPQLNARWSFVFTGVPTIGMKLITLLSRLSVGIPVIEFDNVFLEVAHHQSQVKAIVRLQLWGQPVELNVFTNLQRPVVDDEDDGTLLIESFERLELMGIEVPTPASWKSSRKLQITYLDEDMMIARTNGGEPHLLLRHSPCSTDDETCDLDTDEPTPFFQDAMNKYGKHLSRSLVDRAYNMESREGLDISNIARLIHGIFTAPNGH